MTPTGRGMLGIARRLFRDEDGAALIEYGMLVMLIALLCIIAVKTIGSKVANGFNSANSMLP
jgi:Flp pilus assembly pilin Flp